MKKNVILLFAISYLFLLNVSRAQCPDSLLTESLQTVKKYELTKSPTGAMLRSMVIPGWGQFYNEAYWKIPVIWGAMGALGYAWKWNNDRVIKYDDLYRSEHNSGYYKMREFYRNQRDLNAVFFILAYVMNVIDAYVDAHLFDFETQFRYNEFSPEINLKVKINVSLFREK